MRLLLFVLHTLPEESVTRKQRLDFCIDWFGENIPKPETELEFENPFQLLVAVVLSAQCTDKRVNMVTPALFAAYPSPDALALAEADDVHSYIKSVSFAPTKSRHLVGLAKMLRDFHGGEVPSTVEELVKLPGVGRKTANVITSVVWEQPNMAVDTHVFRVAARIGLTHNAKNPLDAELQLTKQLPEELVHKAHHWLILHGRYTCLARRPQCEQCGLQPVCKFFKEEMQHVIAGTRPMPYDKDAKHKVDGGKKRQARTQAPKANRPRATG